MTTKLEAMVDYLAGREGNPVLLDELADPSSEASRFLEATRTRSRAILEPPIDPERATEPTAIPSRTGNRLERLAWGSLALLALGVALWVGETRIHRLETAFERANSEGRARTEILETALTRLAATTASAVDSTAQIQSALGQIETHLNRFEREVQDLSTRQESPPKVDPALGELREQLAALRRDLVSGEKTSGRRLEDLQATINEVARLVRLLNRTQPPVPADEGPPRRNP